MGLENTGQLGIQTGIDSLDPPKSEGIMNKLFKNTEMLSMVLDAVGSGIDPKSPFAGIGTSLAKSSLASKAAAAEEERSEDMISKILKSMTPGDQQGPSKLSASLNQDGKSLDYTLTGISKLGEAAGEKKASKLSELGKMTPAPTFTGNLTAEDFAADFGEDENL
jgi:hypothetical protein